MIAQCPPHVQAFVDWLQIQYPGGDIKAGPSHPEHPHSWTVYVPGTDATGRIRLTREAMLRAQDLARQFRARLALGDLFWGGTIVLEDMSEDPRFGHHPAVR